MRSLTTALHDKYIAENDEDIDTEDCVIFVPKSRIGKKNKDSDKVTLPSRLTLDDEKINTIGDVDILDDLCANVKELDLGNNLISDWKQIFVLLNHMPELHFLNLMGNQLDECTLEEGHNWSFHVMDLVLNNTGVSWAALATILPYFPCLKELHVSLNGYKTVDIPPGRSSLSSELEKLYMNKTEIESWSEISKFGHAFPCLQSLTIIHSPLSRFTDDVRYSEFSKLISLNITNCSISCWDEIDKIRRFPSLQSLRIADVPYFETIGKKERRQQMVARLPNLVKLNGTPISETEREDAERAFVRLFMESAEKPEMYEVLEKKHGKLDHLAQVDLTPREYIRLEVRFEEKSEFMDIKLNQTVAQFKKMLQNFSGVPSSKTNVYYESVFLGQILDEKIMRIPQKKILSYNLKAEDRFLIERKEPL